tara:strand:+ start:390 stop:560 length:171 start_codon:yes stop_codon:yes gene_type:complete
LQSEVFIFLSITLSTESENTFPLAPTRKLVTAPHPATEIMVAKISDKRITALEIEI